MAQLSQLNFFTTVNEWHALPSARAEVAFAGRSNAGKSSAINALARHTRLAFTSKTPGRTQHLNYFELSEGAYVVDLPGYGYADVPPAIRQHWEKLLSRYLRERFPLKGLVLIMDIRRPLTALDSQLLDIFLPTGRPVHMILTKSDKLSRQAANAQLASVQKAVELFPQVSVQLFSSLKKLGIEEAESVILQWLAAPIEHTDPIVGDDEDTHPDAQLPPEGQS